MADVTVVTACYGDLDDPIEQPEQDIDVKWVAVMRRPFESQTWDVRIEPRPHMHDRMAAKVVKFRPDIYAETKQVIWFDGSVRLKRHDAIRRFLEPLDTYDYATLAHPLWNDIATETKHTKDLNRYRGQMLDEQLAHYKAVLGADVMQAPVYATAIQARNVTPMTVEFGNNVILECARWTCHDQLSVPFISYMLSEISGWRVGIIPEHFYTSSYFTTRVLARPDDEE